MSMIILPLKIISIPLIIIIGESKKMSKRNKTILLLVLTFLYNNLLGFTTWSLIILVSVLKDTYLFFSSIIIMGFLMLTYLIVINMYVKRKIDINNILFTILIAIAFFTGLFLI